MPNIDINTLTSAEALKAIADGKVTFEEFQGLTKAEQEALSVALAGNPEFKVGDCIDLKTGNIEKFELPETLEKPNIFKRLGNWFHKTFTSRTKLNEEQIALNKQKYPEAALQYENAIATEEKVNARQKELAEELRNLDISEIDKITKKLDETKEAAETVINILQDIENGNANIEELCKKFGFKNRDELIKGLNMVLIYDEITMLATNLDAMMLDSRKFLYRQHHETYDKEQRRIYEELILLKEQKNDSAEKKEAARQVLMSDLKMPFNYGKSYYEQAYENGKISEIQYEFIKRYKVPYKPSKIFINNSTDVNMTINTDITH